MKTIVIGIQTGMIVLINRAGAMSAAIALPGPDAKNHSKEERIMEQTKIILDCGTCSNHGTFSRHELVPVQCPECGEKNVHYSKGEAA